MRRSHAKVGKRNFHEVLQQARISLGITSAQAAKEMKMSVSGYSAMERFAIPKLNIALKLAEYFGFELKDLYFERIKPCVRVYKRIGLSDTYRIKSELLEFARAIRAQRIALNMPSAELADKLGIHRSTLSKIEAGYHKPRAELCDNILRYLRLERTVSPHKVYVDYKPQKKEHRYKHFEDRGEDDYQVLIGGAHG